MKEGLSLKAIISRECYKICHSKKMGMVIFLLFIMAILMFSMSIGRKKEMVYVLFDEIHEEISQEEREFYGELDGDIYSLLGYGHCDHNAGDSYFWMTPKALELFREGGELYEKYQEYHFPERMVLQQMIGGEIAPPEQEDFETNWRFYNMLTDASAASYTAVIFTALFFSIDFTRRGYQGALFGGQKRKVLFQGKYLVFFLFFFSLSLAELILAMLVFIPKLWLLPTSYLVKGLFIRSLLDTGRALLFVPFAILGKSEWKAVGLAFIGAIVFMSGFAVVNLDPYQVILTNYWETCSNLGATFQIGIITAAIFIASGFLSSELFQRAELK